MLDATPATAASAWCELLGDNTGSLVSNGVLFSADDAGGLIREVSACASVVGRGCTS